MNSSHDYVIIGCIVHSIAFGELQIIDHGAIIYNKDGIIVKLINIQTHPEVYNSVSDNFPKENIYDFTGKLIVPGFIDAHCHAPQYVFTGTGMDLPLLKWLEKYTFPCEAKFADLEFARFAYEKSIKRHLKCGTTFASYFATIHNDACKVLVDVIEKVGQRAFVGKVSMDRNSPDFYIEETSDGCALAEEFSLYVLSQTETGLAFLKSINENDINDSKCYNLNDSSAAVAAEAIHAPAVMQSFKRYRKVSITDYDIDEDTNNIHYTNSSNGSSSSSNNDIRGRDIHQSKVIPHSISSSLNDYESVMSLAAATCNHKEEGGRDGVTAITTPEALSHKEVMTATATAALRGKRHRSVSDLTADPDYSLSYSTSYSSLPAASTVVSESVTATTAAGTTEFSSRSGSAGQCTSSCSEQKLMAAGLTHCVSFAETTDTTACTATTATTTAGTATTGRATLLNRVDTPLVMPCVTPRFVPTCTGEMMARLGAIALKYGLPIQSHMSESVNEIEWVSDLHPDCSTYAGVYEKYGLLNSHTYMAHCCHSSAEERAILSRTHSSAVHCASSNFMLSSGVMDVRTFLNEGIQVALGTDVAGGYSPSMLDAIRQTVVASRVKGFDKKAYAPPLCAAESHSLAEDEGSSITSDSSDTDHAVSTTTTAITTTTTAAATVPECESYSSLNYCEAFHLATVGGAQVLGMGSVLGNFIHGKKLDCLVVDVDVVNSPIDTFGEESSLQKFEKFLFLGDDRNIMCVFVDGKQVI